MREEMDPSTVVANPDDLERPKEVKVRDGQQVWHKEVLYEAGDVITVAVEDRRLARGWIEAGYVAEYLSEKEWKKLYPEADSATRQRDKQ